MTKVQPLCAAALGLAVVAMTGSAPAVASATLSVPTVRDLGTLGGSTSRAVAVNDLGQVAGTSTTTDGRTHTFVADPPRRGLRGQPLQDLGTGVAVDINGAGTVLGNDGDRVFVWDRQTGRRDLGTLGGLSARATDLNDRGQVVGTMQVPEGDGVVPHAFRWEVRSGRVDLGVGTATAINDLGQVVGLESEMVGFFWDPRTGREPIIVTPSGGVTGFSLQITGINDRTQVIGTALQAFLWDRKSGTQSLDTIGALSSDAAAINRRGQVVGRVQDPVADVDHAYRWTRSSGMVDLTSGTDFAISAAATAINDRGDVVGNITTGTGPAGGEAFLWTRGSGVSRLGTLGGDASTAVDINERGQVAGTATTSAGDEHAVVWSQRPTSS